LRGPNSCCVHDGLQQRQVAVTTNVVIHAEIIYCPFPGHTDTWVYHDWQ
jgi:hypothetical protein